MKILEGLLYIIKDHLKDGWEHYEYAKEAHCEKDDEVLRYHVEEGLHRIERMKVADKLFRKKLADMKYTPDELFKKMYDDIIEEAEYLEQCLTKMKTRT